MLATTNLWGNILIIVIASIFSGCATTQSTVGLTYYIDSSHGSDKNTGLSENSAWKTIAKINSTPLNPGDTILFKSGEIWREELIIKNSGTKSQPITFGVYHNGPAPIISGADEVEKNTWKNYYQKIYSTKLHYTSASNQIYEDGILVEQARWPVDSFRKITAPGSNLTVSDADLPLIKQEHDITGISIVIRTRDWSYSLSHISKFDSKNGLITLAEPIEFPSLENYGYYMVGGLWMLQGANQWSYDKENFLYIWTKNGDHPALHHIEYASRDHGILIDKASHINLFGIEVRNSTESNIKIKKGNYILIDTVKLSGGKFAIHSSPAADNIIIRNNKISKTITGGILFRGYNSLIENNTIADSGNNQKSPPLTYLYGKANGGGNGLEIRGALNLIKGNVISRSANNGIFSGKSSINDVQGNEVKENTIDQSCLLMKDCAGIYTNWIGLIASNNIVKDTIGSAFGTSNLRDTRSHGIYLDAGHKNSTILSNIIKNTDYGIFIHSGGGDKIIKNSVKDARNSGLHIQEDGEPPGYPGIISNNFISENYFEVRSDAPAVVSLKNRNGKSINSFGVFDKNTYCHPKNKKLILIKTTTMDASFTAKEWADNFSFNQKSSSISKCMN